MTSTPETAEPVPKIVPATDASRQSDCSDPQQTQARDDSSSHGAVSPSTSLQGMSPESGAQKRTSSVPRGHGDSNENTTNVAPDVDRGSTDHGVHPASDSKTQSENGSERVAMERDVVVVDSSSINSQGRNGRQDQSSHGNAVLPYRYRVELLHRFLPHLRTVARSCDEMAFGYWRGSPVISIMECSPGARFTGYRKLPDIALPSKMDEMTGFPPCTDKERVIVVEDLLPKTIELLGSEFKLDPDFFASHLQGLWYETKYHRQAPWKTSALSKRYCSVKWWRPVRRLLLGEQNEIQWSAMMSDDYEYRKKPVVYRTEFACTVEDKQFDSDSRRNGLLTGVTAWEERVTIHRTIRHEKTLSVVILVDPLPKVGPNAHGQKRERLPFEHICPRGRQMVTSDGTLDNIETRNQIKELDCYFQETQTTRNDILSWTCNTGSNQALHICSAIIKVLETDTVCLLEIIAKTLVQVTEGTMNESLLQERLSLWKKVMTSYLIELPSIRLMLRDFGYFLKSCGIAGDSQSNIDALTQRIEETIQQTENVYTSLRTEISIIESKRGIVEAERGIAEAESVAKLTELAFIFIPISFAASVFSMQVKEFQVPPPIYAFVIAALLALGISYSMRLSIRSRFLVTRKDALFNAVRSHARISADTPLPTHIFILYLVAGFWGEQWTKWRMRRRSKKFRPRMMV